jgi:hypothetical protein
VDIVKKQILLGILSLSFLAQGCNDVRSRPGVTAKSGTQANTVNVIDLSKLTTAEEVIKTKYSKLSFDCTLVTKSVEELKNGTVSSQTSKDNITWNILKETSVNKKIGFHKDNGNLAVTGKFILKLSLDSKFSVTVNVEPELAIKYFDLDRNVLIDSTSDLSAFDLTESQSVNINNQTFGPQGSTNLSLVKTDCTLNAVVKPEYAE